MSARDDYLILAEAAMSGSRASVNAHELAAALDEVDLLREDVSNLLAKLATIHAEVDLIWRSVGRPLGESKARAAIDTLRLLTAHP